MKVLYKPFKIAARSIGTRLGKAAFDAVWEKVGDNDAPPSATAGHVNLAKVAAAAALEAATMAAIGATIDQLTARSFHYLIGAWPEKPSEPE